jgi:hypothetical protein
MLKELFKKELRQLWLRPKPSSAAEPPAGGCESARAVGTPYDILSRAAPVRTIEIVVEKGGRCRHGVASFSGALNCGAGLIP